MKNLVLVVAALACGAGVARTQSPGDVGARTGPYVEFGYVRSGSTQPGATTGDDLAPGRRATALFTSSQALCGTTLGSDRPVSEAPQFAVRLAAELLEQQPDGVYSVRVSARRLRAPGQVEPAPPLEQVVSFREGDRVVLDMLRDPTPPPSCSTTAITLEARLRVRQDPALARRLFVADVWLSHTDETGHEWTQHMTANVNGTADVPILFNDVTFPLPKLDPDQDEFTAYLRVTGTIRARARADGLIDLDLATARDVGLLLPNSPPGLGGRSTHKVVAVRAGETTAIEIPPPSSGFTMTALRIGEKMPGSGAIGARPGGDGGQLAAMPAAFINNGRFVFNTGVFFKGHVTRLLVRVRPAE